MQALTRRSAADGGRFRFQYVPHDGYEAGVAVLAALADGSAVGSAFVTNAAARSATPALM
jgi:hypothetical protein